MADPVQTTLIWVSISALVVGLTYLFSLSRRCITQPDTSTDKAVTQRAARNSILMLATSFGDRILFWLFWIVALRLLGPEGNGKYAFATNLLVYFAAATNFGLSTLVTRDVARNPSQIEKLFGNALAIRAVLVTIAVPLMVGVAFSYWASGALSETTVAVCGLLAISLIPNAINQSYAAIYSAYEQMGFRGATAVGTALITIAGGILVLLLGWGVTGLAIVANIAGAVTFYTLARPLGFHLLGTIRKARWTEAQVMLKTSLPLMLNELLASIFFQIDILVIQPIAGATMVGKYNSAYKFISAMAAISPAVIMPLFPALARARGDSSQMRLWIQRAWRPMILLAAPAVILFTLFGREIVYTFWGDPFLPEAGTLLAVLIWVVPFLYLNGLFQYVLIATDQLRSIAISFSLASMLNIALNILLLQQMGIVGAAYATIATEIVLLVLFSLALRDRQNLVSPLRPSIRPIAAAFLMSASALLLRELGWLIASVTSLLIYLTALVATRAMTREDLKFLRSSVRN